MRDLRAKTDGMCTSGLLWILFMFSIGTHLKLTRTFKYDGTSQGIPKCILHADRQHKAGSERFDWVTILERDKKNHVPVHLW